MIDQESTKSIEEMKEQLARIEKSVESTRKYFLWTLVITVVFLVLPLVGLFFAVPLLLSTYSSLGL